MTIRMTPKVNVRTLQNSLLRQQPNVAGEIAEVAPAQEASAEKAESPKSEAGDKSKAEPKAKGSGASKQAKAGRAKMKESLLRAHFSGKLDPQNRGPRQGARAGLGLRQNPKNEARQNSHSHARDNRGKTGQGAGARSAALSGERGGRGKAASASRNRDAAGSRGKLGQTGRGRGAQGAGADQAAGGQNDGGSAVRDARNSRLMSPGDEDNQFGSAQVGVKGNLDGTGFKVFAKASGTVGGVDVSAGATWDPNSGEVDAAIEAAYPLPGLPGEVKVKGSVDAAGVDGDVQVGGVSVPGAVKTVSELPEKLKGALAPNVPAPQDPVVPTGGDAAPAGGDDDDDTTPPADGAPDTRVDPNAAPEGPRNVPEGEPNDGHTDPAPQEGGRPRGEEEGGDIEEPNDGHTDPAPQDGGRPRGEGEGGGDVEEPNDGHTDPAPREGGGGGKTERRNSRQRRPVRRRRD